MDMRRVIQMAVWPFRGKLTLQLFDLGSKFHIFLEGLLIENGYPVGCLICSLPVLVELLDGRGEATGRVSAWLSWHKVVYSTWTRCPKQGVPILWKRVIVVLCEREVSERPRHLRGGRNASVKNNFRYGKKLNHVIVTILCDNIIYFPTLPEPCEADCFLPEVSQSFP